MSSRDSQTIIKNILSLSVADVISRLMTFILFAVVGKMLGETSLGGLSIAVAVSSYFVLFSDFGLTTLGIKEISRNRGESGRYGSNVLLIQILLSCVLIAVLVVLLSLLPFDNRLKLMTLLYGLTIFPSSLNLTYILQAHERMELAAVGRIISQIGYAAVGIVVIFYVKDIFYLPVVQLAANIVGCAVSFVLVKKYLRFRFERPNWGFIKQLTRQASPFVLTAVMIQLYYNIDTVMLGVFEGERQTGYYSAAYKILLLILAILAIVNGTTFPALSRLSHERQRFVNAIRAIAKYLGIIAFPSAVFGIYFAKPIIFFLFKASFSPAVPVFQILMFYVLFKFLSANYEWAIIVEGGIRKVSVAVTCAALLNIILNLLLIPRFGILGAAWATVASEVVSLFIQGYYFRQVFLNLSIVKQYTLKPLVASLLALTLMVVLPHNLHVIILMLFSSLFYGVILLAIRAVSLSEVKSMVFRGS